METPESKPGYRSWSGLAAGVAVIIVGLLFLMNNFGVRLGFEGYHNWWALFILVGAAGPLGYAVQRYRSKGKLDNTVLSSLLSAVSIIIVALIFLLDLSWDLWWPLFIIIGGCWMLLGHWKHASNSASADK